MAENPEVNQAGSLSSHLTGLVPKAVLDSAPGRFGTAMFDNSSVGAKANLANEFYHSVTTPAKEPGGNLINDMATSLWQAHKAEFNKADAYSKAAQKSNTFGDWAGNTLQSVGHLGAAALPLFGPAAAKAGERLGSGDIAGGLGATAGLVGSTVLGGAATEKAAAKLGLTAKAAGAAGEISGKIPSPIKVMPKPKIEATYKAASEPGQLLNKHTVEVHIPGGKDKVGHVQAIEETDRPGSWRIDSSELHPDLRDQGLGKGAYERLVQHAKESGAHEIHSGGVVSEDAAKVWESLAKKHPVDRISTKDPKTGEIQTQYRMKIDPNTPSLIQPAHMPPPKGPLSGAARVLSMPEPIAAVKPPNMFEKAMYKAAAWGQDKFDERAMTKLGKESGRPPVSPVYENEGAGTGIHLVKRD